MRWAILWVAMLAGFAGESTAAGTWASTNKALPAPAVAGRVVVNPAPASSGVPALPAGPLADLLGGRTYTPGLTEGEVLMRDLLSRAPGPRGDIPVKAVRAVPWAAIAGGVAKAIPVLGTAVYIAELLNSIRCREKFGGGAECDDGQPEQQTIPEQWCFGASCFSSSAAAGTYVGQLRAGQNGVQFVSASTYGVNQTTVAWTYRFVCAGQPSPGPMNCTDVGYETLTYQQLPPAMRCPAIMVNGVSFVPTKGVDDKCPTTIYEPKTEPQVATKVETYGNKSRAPLVVPELDARAVPMPHPAPTFETPPSVVGERDTTVHPDGSTTVKDRDFTFEPDPDGYRWRERETTRTYPPGTEPPAQGLPPGEGAPPATVETKAPTSTELKTCGLPGTPPCKIDETGTPEWSDPAGTADEVAQDWMACITSPAACFPALPSLNWGFTLPSVCTAIPTPAFAAEGVSEINLCGFQSIFHDIMSMVWAAAGLFAAVALVLRDSTGGK